jgi:hypothetical protein
MPPHPLAASKTDMSAADNFTVAVAVEDTDAARDMLSNQIVEWCYS